jgi:glycosyltransferase involved in cell wall biosynthesis
MNRLVIQLPALNEAASIEAVLKSLPATLAGVDEIRTVVVDDGSTDATGRIAAACGADVVRHAKPRGVGAAFRSGIRRAIELGADVLVTIDADGQFSTEDIRKLIAPILADEADFVTGSRFKDPAFEPEMPGLKRWGNDVIARWISRMTGQDFHDVSCGFRAYSKDAFLRLNLLGDFTYTHEVFLSLAYAGLRIQEVPIRVIGVRKHGQSRVASNLWKYAWRAAGIILGTYRDYRPLRFFGIIALVMALMGIVALSFLMVHWLQTGAFFPYKAVGFAGGAFCGAALLVYLIGLVAEMQVRLRNGLEDVLFRVRRLDQHSRRQDSGR